MALRWLANLILALMLAGLGLGVWHVLSVEETPPTLAGLDPVDLSVIALERAGEPRIRLERTPDGWRMREPLDLDADPGQVERLLGVLKVPVARSFPARSAALDELGLAPPKLRLTLDQASFGFGGLDPSGQHRYVLADGLVHLVGDGLYPRLIAPAIDYCSRRPLPAAPPPVFATLKGVPLAAPSLKALAGLTAERLEPMGVDLAGESLEVKLGDGTLLRFLVSPDRRRWTRADLRLCYVLGDGLLLELDPGARDPGPPAHPPVPVPGRAPPVIGPVTGAAPDGMPDGVAPEEPAAPSPPPSEPFAPDPGMDGVPPAPAAGAAPPVVHLRPNQSGAKAPKVGTDAPPPVGFGAEPEKRPPEGFGVDPFAPTPAPGAASPAEGWAAPRPHAPHRH